MLRAFKIRYFWLACRAAHCKRAAFYADEIGGDSGLLLGAKSGGGKHQK
jgi:hypothetical protein